MFWKGLGRSVSILGAAGLLAAGGVMAAGGALSLAQRAGWHIADKFAGALPERAMHALAGAQSSVAQSAGFFSTNIGPDAALYEASIAAAGCLVCVGLLRLLAEFFIPYKEYANGKRS